MSFLEDGEQLRMDFESVESDYATRAYELVVTEARRILDSEPDDVQEFVMGMGAYGFSATPGGKYDGHSMTEEDWEDESIPHADSDTFIPVGRVWPDFVELVDALDNLFHITGNPIRMRTGMKPVHDWGDTSRDPVVYEPLDS